MKMKPDKFEWAGIIVWTGATLFIMAFWCLVFSIFKAVW